MRLFELEHVKGKIDLSSIMTPDIKMLGKLFAQHGFSFRIVGGAVRDLTLGKAPKDIDFATDATPDEMKEMFDNAGLKRLQIASGEAHGTITVLGPKTREPFEITTLRTDTETDGRHATVAFTRDWKTDSERRDLTYNALSVDLNGNLYDYHSGLDDMKTGVSRFVGDADARIQEDYLRILRLFRFAARYNHKLNEPTKEAVARNVSGLTKLSGERIWNEVSKILAGPNTELSLSEMQETGVAQAIGLPIVELPAVSKIKTKTNNPITVLATQLTSHDQANALRNRWKWSNTEFALATFLLDHKFEHTTEKDLQSLLVHGANKEFVVELAHLKNLQDVAAHSIPAFPLTGNDLIALGMKPGPTLGKTLASLKQHWVDSSFTLSKEELLALTA
jgi:tRNA nucleotidyltransferase (CCA-adding enzyme)